MKLPAPGDSDQMAQISTLPNEVLGLVFQLAHRQGYGVGSDADGIACSQSGQAKVEVVVSHVCNLWREIALSCPYLWATFRVQRPAANQISNKYQALQVYLSRSGDADLDLFFDYVGIPVECPTLMDMLYKIVPHLHRIKRLILLSDGINFITPFYHQLTDASSPRLEHFEVSTGRYHNIRIEGVDTELHWNPKILNVGPQTIKYLKLDASAVCRFRPPFQNLVHFTLESGLAPFELNLLWVCLEQILSLPYIETLSLWDDLFDAPDQWPARPMRPIDARRLKHVRIGSDWSDHVQSFYIICYVRAPLLETLTLVAVDLRRLDTLVTIQPTPAAVFPSFKTLYLVDVVAPPESKLLKQLAFVTAYTMNLTIATSRTYHDLLFQELWEGSTPRPGIVRFWPEVETLSINIPYTSKLSQSPDGLLHSCREYWGKLTTIRHPSRSASALVQWPDHGVLLGGDSGREIRTEEVGDILTEYWPPDYNLFTQQLNREWDPFYRHVRQG